MAFIKATEFHLGKGEVAISCRKNENTNKFLLGLYDIEEGFQLGELTNGQAIGRRGGGQTSLYFDNAESVDIMIRHLEELKYLITKEKQSLAPLQLAEKISGW